MGPEWWFPLLELVIVNTITILVIHFGSYSDHIWALAVAILLLVIQNFIFLAFCLKNPGYAPRDPRVHSRNHLDKVNVIK